MDLVKMLLNREKRAAARLITMIENNDPNAIPLLSQLYKHTGKAKIIGITGPPGAGKSTLTDKLVKKLREKENLVGVIAIDPTSPFTGGSILGDRVRMTDLSTDPGVFIRSMGTRGHLGGLSKATQGAVKVLDIYGMDYIIIETVGVGQSEVDIVKAADTVLMVMVPGLGDDIQTIKAGIMEIADVFAINKSDREGASRTKLEVEMMLDFNSKDWRPPVNSVIAIDNKGIDELLESIYRHQDYMEKSGKLMERRTKNAQMEILDLIQQKIMKNILGTEEKRKEMEELAEKVAKRELEPYEVSNIILNKCLQSNGNMYI